LRIYKKIENKGRLILNDGKQHQFQYTVSDLFGNASAVSFQLAAIETGRMQSLTEKKPSTIRYFPYQQRNTFVNSENEVLVNIPKGVLYDNLYFEYKKDSALKKAISPVYWLHKNTTPLHSYINVSIKMEGLPKAIRDKALIVSTTDGKSMYAEGGSWNGDNIRVKTRSFGGYAVAIDTLPPKITPINIFNNANMGKKWSISVKVTDDLSGLDFYRGTIDGKWVLMQYDAKNDLLTYYFDERLKAGKHLFQLIVRDGVNNQSVFKADFVR